jgi:hypothetical protein
MENRTSTIRTIFAKKKVIKSDFLAKASMSRKTHKHENTHFPSGIHPREFGADFVMVVVVVISNISSLKILSHTFFKVVYIDKGLYIRSTLVSLAHTCLSNN